MIRILKPLYISTIILSSIMITGCTNKITYDQASEYYFGVDDYGLELQQFCENRKYYEENNRPHILGTEKEKELVCSLKEDKVLEAKKIREEQYAIIKEANEYLSDGYSLEHNAMFGGTISDSNKIKIKEILSKLEDGIRKDYYIEAVDKEPGNYVK